ncbi:MAG: LacI family DNA-binding transcriptional regulator, partial [Geminicoccaceae bacterium]
MEPQHGKRVTITDVARAAGVSPATVSQAFNGRRQVDPVTRERIQAVALELGYRPNPTAQRLRTGRSGMIALLSSMPFAVAAGPSRLGFLMEIAAVAAGAALSNGLALILVPPVEHGQLALDALAIDGAILVEPATDDPGLALLRARGLPFVTVGKVAGAEDIPFVDLHSTWTTNLLLQHLWAQGARQIALMIGRQARNSYLEAETAYADFAADCHMRRRVLRIDETGGETAGRAACRRLLAEAPEIDGICATVDAFAVGALQAA